MRFDLATTLAIALFVVLTAEVGGQNIWAEEPSEASVEHQRLEIMRSHVAEIEFHSQQPSFPEKLQDQPLFRYDDLTRGYVDGTVWRLGATGRPLAIVTAELHPKYAGQPCIICDYLSLSPNPFVAKVAPGSVWTPSQSAVELKELPGCPALTNSMSQRLFQLKKMAERFTAQQSVEGVSLELRLLPRPIDRYSPTEKADDDAAIFLFVSGRNPGLILVIEATEAGWKYGAGRLSGPSQLVLKLDGESVWEVQPTGYSWRAPYTAANYPTFIP